MLMEHVVVILGRLREHALSAETTAAYLHWTFAGVSYLGNSAGSARQCPTPRTLPAKASQGMHAKLVTSPPLCRHPPPGIPDHQANQPPSAQHAQSCEIGPTVKHAWISVASLRYRARDVEGLHIRVEMPRPRC